MTTSLSGLPSTKTHGWQEAVSEDLQRIEDIMLDVAIMGHDRLDRGVEAIIRAGGKRMRPAISVLAGQAYGSQSPALYSVAASIELLHTATLVHDDLIDGADERRGAPTLHSTLPIGITVLTGDFLFAQAASLAADANNVDVVRLFAETLVKICQGEVLQAQTRWVLPSYDVYIERIYGKTAALFEAAAAAGAMVAEAGSHAVNQMADFGRHLGLAFQIVDDALDFMGSAQQLGKPAGHDMQQGIFNLPVMYFVDEIYKDEQAFIREVEMGERLDDLIDDIRQSGMVEKSLKKAREHVGFATDLLTQMPSGQAADYLLDLAQNAIKRVS